MSDTTPSPAEPCKNCSLPLAPSAKYCPGCGQKKYHGPPTLWNLFSDFFETIFNLDNRLFITLRDLVVPGKLTNKYLAGKQRPFFQPLRLFFVSTVLMLSTYAILTVDRVGDTFDSTIETARAKAYHRIFELEMLADLDTLEKEFPAASSLALLDTIRSRHLTLGRDSMTIGYIEFRNDNTLNGKNLMVDMVDFHTMPPGELAEKYGVEHWMHRYQISQIVTIARSGARSITNIMGQLIWGVVFLIPLSALMLKLIYIRRKRNYVEHLVFSLHVHSFLFLLQALAAIVFYWFDSQVLLFATIPLTVIYFVLAQKRVYRQGWGKTFMKAFLLFLGYCFILSLAVGIGVLASLILY